MSSLCYFSFWYLACGKNDNTEGCISFLSRFQKAIQMPRGATETFAASFIVNHKQKLTKSPFSVRRMKALWLFLADAGEWSQLLWKQQLQTSRYLWKLSVTTALQSREQASGWSSCGQQFRQQCRNPSHLDWNHSFQKWKWRSHMWDNLKRHHWSHDRLLNQKVKNKRKNPANSSGWLQSVCSGCVDGPLTLTLTLRHWAKRTFAPLITKKSQVKKKNDQVLNHQLLWKLW